MRFTTNAPPVSTPFHHDRSTPVAWGQLLVSTLIPAAEAVPIPFLLRIEHDLVRERICVTSGDRRNMVFVAVHNTDYLHCRLLQRTFHCSSYLLSFYGDPFLSGMTSKRKIRHRFSPPSVLGRAIVTSTNHSSQRTSSSLALPIPVSHPLFLLFLSKNCTAICPRTPPLGVFDEVS
jgi:hypothetical protein